MPSFKKLTSLILVFALGIVVAVSGLRLFGKQLSSVDLSSDKVFQKERVVDEESVVIDVVDKLSPSVVSIAIKNRQTANPFSFPSTSKSEESGIGTGFVVSTDGLILTNKHVVSQNADYVAIIKNSDGTDKKYDVSEIHKDSFNDLAILQVDASGLVPVELGDSDHIKVGQKVIAIGNALGRFENTVTVGVVSGLGRGVAPIDPATGVAERLDDLIQTDAAINPGNSGGPLLNSAGQAIGINTAVASAENIGFAIKINIVKQLISDFNTSGGKISRPLLGVRYTHISKDTALLNDVPEGELVREVVSGSAADRAGVKVGDILTQFDGQKLTEEDALSKLIRGKKVGDEVKLKVFRDGQTLDLSSKLGEAPNQ